MFSVADPRNLAISDGIHFFATIFRVIADDNRWFSRFHAMEKLSLDWAFYCCNLMLDDSTNQLGHIYETDDHFSDIRPEIWKESPTSSMKQPDHGRNISLLMVQRSSFRKAWLGWNLCPVLYQGYIPETNMDSKIPYS